MGHPSSFGHDPRGGSVGERPKWFGFWHCVYITHDFQHHTLVPLSDVSCSWEEVRSASSEGMVETGKNLGPVGDLKPGNVQDVRQRMEGRQATPGGR